VLRYAYVPTRSFPLQARGRGGEEEPRVVPKDTSTSVSERRGVPFTVTQQRDRDGPRPVRVCAGGEGNETVYGSGAQEAVSRIGGRVDGRPGVCAGRVDVERGWEPSLT
jgi:hypothetical protein